MRNIFLDQIVNDNLAAVHPSQSITPLGPKLSRVDDNEEPSAATPQPKHKPYFTTETQSSQRSEYFLIKNSLLCALGASAVKSSESFFITESSTRLALKFDAAGAENCSVLSFGARNIRNEVLCQSLGVGVVAW
jgi:hypothetical protein